MQQIKRENTPTEWRDLRIVQSHPMFNKTPAELKQWIDKDPNPPERTTEAIVLLFRAIKAMKKSRTVP